MTAAPTQDRAHQPPDDGRMPGSEDIPTVTRSAPWWVELEQRLGEHRALVQGDTDSERLFALITRETELRGGDVEEGIRAAIGWVADNVPVFALNFVLTTPTDLWALRYPQTHDLFVLERDADSGGSQHPRVEQSGWVGAMRIRSPELTSCRSVVVATERMDDDPGWRPLEPGELLHVPVDLRCAFSEVIDRPPAQLLTLSDLDQRAAASQTADTGAAERADERPGRRHDDEARDRGLGRMGLSLSELAVQRGHQVVAWDPAEPARRPRSRQECRPSRRSRTCRLLCPLLG